MKSRFRFLSGLAFLIVVLLPCRTAHAQKAHTPKPGSPERQAICDAARAYVLGKYTTGPLPQPIVFKIDHLAVAENYANMEAVALFKDGRYVDPQYLPDIGYNFCLQNGPGGWRVAVDLSRSDVPDAVEAEAIRHSLPPDFPHSLFSPTWQRLLAR